MKGWTGNILRVDLSNRTCTVEGIDPEVTKAYIGGHGVATKILMDEMDPKVDPLSPDNKLIFSTGPLTGTAAVTGSRYMITSKSPLTDLLGFANSGGFFGPAIKSAGFDHIIIEGGSDNPVYLWIDDDKVEIKDAGHVWGKDTHETEAVLRSELEDGGKRVRVSCIGPAGEKLVRFAAVMNDKHRAAGRCGIGAVMGSKKLKAVVVRGSGKAKIADEEGFKSAVKNALSQMKASPVTAEVFPAFGTSANVMLLNELGILPTKNFQKSSFGKNAEKISGEAVTNSILKKRKACFGCPIACGRGTEITEPGFEGKGEGPEYETLAMLGSNLEIDNLAAITKANYICNELGMDTISAGGAIACAMEMFEKGYLSKKDTGLDLKFGDDKLLVKLVEMIGNREGFGNELAEGGHRLAQKYGHSECFMGIHKMELPAYEPRGAKGMGINYITSTIGPSHCRGYTVAMEVMGSPAPLDPIEEKGKAMAAKAMQDMTGAWDATGLCLFATLGIEVDDALAMLFGATGQFYDLMGFIKAGERIFNIQRLFNLKAGVKKEDEKLPDRFYEEPLPGGSNAGAVLSLEDAMSVYYNLRGWDKDHVPYRGKLNTLGLGEYA
ncbi:MAG: aldehyde ferredoxin oxidoreductase family protein [Desulfobacterales bacterium]|nr:aldehyde ferredoxin oxidoreductase family protein [Desulfobacterales bacterium]